MPHRTQMPVHAPDQGVATVPHLLADRVGRDRRPAVERLQPRGTVRVPEDVWVYLACLPHACTLHNAVEHLPNVLERPPGILGCREEQRLGWLPCDVSPEDRRELRPERVLAVKYEVKNGGRTYIEPKDNVRDRLGHSPDLADICAMALGGAAEVCSIGGEVGNYGF